MILLVQKLMKQRSSETPEVLHVLNSHFIVCDWFLSFSFFSCVPFPFYCIFSLCSFPPRSSIPHPSSLSNYSQCQLYFSFFSFHLPHCLSQGFSGTQDFLFLTTSSLLFIICLSLSLLAQPPPVANHYLFSVS